MSSNEIGLKSSSAMSSSSESKISSSSATSTITSSSVRKSELTRSAINNNINSCTNDFSASVDLLCVGDDDDDVVGVECMSVTSSTSTNNENDSQSDSNAKGNLFTKLIESEKIMYEDLMEEDVDLELQGDDLDVELMGVCSGSDTNLVEGLEGDNSPAENSISPQPQPDLLIHLSAEDEFESELESIHNQSNLQSHRIYEQEGVTFSEFNPQDRFHHQQNGTRTVHREELNASVKEERRKKMKKTVVKSEENVESVTKNAKSKMASEGTVQSSFDSSVSQQQEVVNCKGSVTMSSATTTKTMTKMSSVGLTENVAVKVENGDVVLQNGEINDEEKEQQNNNKTKKKSLKKKNEHISVKESDEIDCVSLKKNYERNGLTNNKYYGLSRDYDEVATSPYSSLPNTYIPSGIQSNNTVSISKLKSIYNNAANGQSSVKRKISASHSASATPHNDQRVFAKVSVAHLRRSFGDLTNITNNNNEDDQHRPLFTSSLQKTSTTATNGLQYRFRSSSATSGRITESLSSSSQHLPHKLNNSPFHAVYLQFNNASQSKVVSEKKSSFNKFDKLARNSSMASLGSQDAEKSTGRLSRSPSSVNGENDGSQAQKAVVEKKYCRSCEKQVFQMEMIKAEKSQWHRACFKCSQTQCSKTLSVDTYQSHEGQLYCKPHFKELFQPKAVFEDVDKDSVTERKSKLPEVIIRENQPVELPPDVVRACEKSSTGLEDIQIDVRSRFELFERQASKEAQLKSPSPDESHNRVNVKKSASVIAKLAKYQTQVGMDIGVPDEALNGNSENLENEESSSDEAEDRDSTRSSKKVKSPLAAMNEVMQLKHMEEVRSKWEVGMNSKREELNEARKEEMAKFRSRLCLGKSNQLKEMYEKAVDESEAGVTSQGGGGTVNAELEQLRLEKAKSLREMFERGEVVNEDDEFEESDNVTNGANKNNERIVDRDLAVFESAVAKQSRSLFKEMDKTLVRSGGSTVFQFGVGGIKTPSTPDIKKNIEFPMTENKVQNGIHSLENAAKDIVRSSDVREDASVKTEELSNKFKFFETYEKEEQNRALSKKRQFRFTPPRDVNGQVIRTDPRRNESPEDSSREVYRDPNVVRSEDKVAYDEEEIMQTKTASKMLNVFRQLEEKNSDSNVTVDGNPRPLKQFTPPREPQRFIDDQDSEEEEQEEEDEEEYDEEEEERTLDDPVANAQKLAHDEFLKEVGSLARARSLRAKFERWEQQENVKNSQLDNEVNGDDTSLRSDTDRNRSSHDDSLDSAKNIRAKFELQLQQLQSGVKFASNENETLTGDIKNANKKPHRVNRFVSSSETADTTDTAKSLTASSSSCWEWLRRAAYIISRQSGAVATAIPSANIVLPAELTVANNDQLLMVDDDFVEDDDDFLFDLAHRPSSLSDD